MPKYDVLRQHEGDKFYRPGDTRDAASADVAHLVRGGVLRLASGEKADPAHENKAEPKPANKADAAPDVKKGESLTKSKA